MDSFLDESQKKFKQEIKQEIKIEHSDNFSPEEQKAISIILDLPTEFEHNERGAPKMSKRMLQQILDLKSEANKARKLFLEDRNETNRENYQTLRKKYQETVDTAKNEIIRESRVSLKLSKKMIPIMPWITTEMLQERNETLKARKRFLKNSNKTNSEKYEILKKEYKNTLRTAKNTYFEENGLSKPWKTEIDKSKNATNDNNGVKECQSKGGKVVNKQLLDDDFLIFDVLSPPKLGWATSHPLPDFDTENNSSSDRLVEEQVEKRKPSKSTGLLRIGFNKEVFKNQLKSQLTPMISKPSDNTWL